MAGSLYVTDTDGTMDIYDSECSSDCYDLSKKKRRVRLGYIDMKELHDDINEHNHDTSEHYKHYDDDTKEEHYDKKPRSRIKMKCVFCDCSSFEKRNKETKIKNFKKKTKSRHGVRCDTCGKSSCWLCIDAIMSKMQVESKEVDQWYQQMLALKTRTNMMGIVSSNFCHACEFNT